MIHSIDEQCPKVEDIVGERILIFGGSGSLGTKSIQRWIEKNKIINVSRDEEKQWLLRRTINNQNLSQRIGDIANEEDVSEAILKSNPTIICIFACLKHIDLCEQFPKKSIDINAKGIMNVEHVLQRFKTNVKTVLFVSTDKACLPITTYGCSKAIAESFLQNVNINDVKWVGVRYGNVLNSSGSILPFLHSQKINQNPYPLTHQDMTRFIMSLDQSVNLIEYAVLHGKQNEIIIPALFSMRIEDLFHIFQEITPKDIQITGLRCKEKIHEDLLSPMEAKMAYVKGLYYHLGNKEVEQNVEPFDSSKHLISKQVLKEYLSKKGYL